MSSFRIVILSLQVLEGRFGHTVQSNLAQLDGLGVGMAIETARKV